MTQEKLPHRKELCLQSEAGIGNDACFFSLTGSGQGYLICDIITGNRTGTK